MDDINKGIDPALKAAREGSGIMEGADNDPLADETEDETETEEGTGVEEEEAEEEGSESEADETEEGDDSEEDEPGDDSEDEEEEKEGDEKPSPASRRGRVAPSKPTKAERAAFQQINSLKSELRNEFKSSIDEIKALIVKGNKKGETVEEQADEIETIAADLAKRINVEPESLKEILNAAVGIATKKLGAKEKAELPEEIKNALTELEELKKDSAEKKELDHFNGEWEQAMPAIQKKYPNAKAAELNKAKEVMYKLARSEKYHQYDLDYILFKESKKFDTLLQVAAKRRGLEQGKSITRDESEDDSQEETMPDIEDMTPAAAKRMDMVSMNDKPRKDYRINKPIRG